MDITSQQKEDIKAFVLRDMDENIFLSQPDPFWRKLKDQGTAIWLDTGDMDKAARIWSTEMTALTTNNTLLNQEIQKGIYDDFILRAKKIVEGLPLKQQVLETAFMLNARHGLRLARKFNCMVSVELHTDLAHDYRATVDYGLRLFDICPDQFLIKIPYTATGMIAARYLKEHHVRINMTLEFSARQNTLATLIARPDYVNVFLGRLGAYVMDNGLGSGKGIGERTVMATQKLISKLGEERPDRTRLIAASIREPGQLETLTGVDVMTIPPDIAMAGHRQLEGNFTLQPDRKFAAPARKKTVKQVLEKLWNVTEPEMLLAHHLGRYPPKSGMELTNLAKQAGCSDMFPILSGDDLDKIASGGKIPLHANWSSSIMKGDLAMDTLLNLAGLASFAKDQASLDSRIEKILHQ